MNIQRTNMKRFAVLLAATLVVGSCLQQVHAFCLWNDCAQASATNSEEVVVESRCCCHSQHACKPSRVNERSDESCPPFNDQNEPCQQHCWCWQSPLPSLIKVSETTLLGFGDFLAIHATGISVKVAEADNLTTWLPSTEESISATSLARCSQLCRFLI